MRDELGAQQRGGDVVHGRVGRGRAQNLPPPYAQLQDGLDQSGGLAAPGRTVDGGQVRLLHAELHRVALVVVQVVVHELHFCKVKQR